MSSWSTIPPMMALAFVLGSSLPGTAAEHVVRLETPPEIAKDLSSYPRIADPVDAAEKKINAAVARLDAKVRTAVAECRSEAANDRKKDVSWERSVDVPMRGPRYISFVITDNSYCGGLHPNVATMAIVYDLTTGNPIDWSAVLPPSSTGKLELSEGMDGTKMIALSGKALFDAYLKRYRPRAPGSKQDEDVDCREAVTTYGDNGGRPLMMAWLDARQAALVVYFDLAHVVQACTEQVAIPVADLRKAGAKPLLVEAIEAAHRDR